MIGEKVEYAFFVVASAAIIGALVIVAVVPDHYNISSVLLTLALVLITCVYAMRTSDIAKANTIMAKEMREQTVVGSRPIVIPRPVHAPDLSDTYKGQPDERFQWFEVYNAGNGPAINLEVIMLNEEKKSREIQSQAYLRADEYITYSPSILGNHLDSTCYVLCRYQSVIRTNPLQWYETWVPFTPKVSQRGDYTFVTVGETEFKESIGKLAY